MEKTDPDPEDSAGGMDDEWGGVDDEWGGEDGTGTGGSLSPDFILPTRTTQGFSCFGTLSRGNTPLRSDI